MFTTSTGAAAAAAARLLGFGARERRAAFAAGAAFATGVAGFATGFFAAFFWTLTLVFFALGDERSVVFACFELLDFDGMIRLLSGWWARQDRAAAR
jgi:hypothetical protein